jgi:hypothetical protein
MPNFTNDVSSEPGVDAIEGISTDGRGLIGMSTSNYGLRAHSTQIAGIRGSSEKSRGVEGWATDSEGVVGISTSGNGVMGQAEGEGIGVLGTSTSGIGVAGTTSSTTSNPNGDGRQAAVLGRGSLAGRFEGDVEVTGLLKIAEFALPNILRDIRTQSDADQTFASSLSLRIQTLERQVRELQIKVGINP